MDLNKYFAVILEKHKEELSFDIENHKIKNLFDFNDLNFIDMIFTKKHIPNINTIDKETLDYYHYDIDYIGENLTFIVPISQYKDEKYFYTQYHPFSMRQVFYLYSIGINIDILCKLYKFSKEEIANGYAIRQGLKQEFYPLEHENRKQGIYFFSHEIIGLPEFISNQCLNSINGITH